MLVINIAYPAFIKSMTPLESGFSFISFDTMVKDLSIILLAVGIFIGVIGSSASMKKYLDV